MATYEAHSRAPLIPLDDLEKAVNGEILVQRKDSKTYLLLAIADADGNKQVIDLVRTVTDQLLIDVKDARQYKISEELPAVTREHLWFKVTNFDNEDGTMVPINEYPVGQEIDQL